MMRLRSPASPCHPVTLSCQGLNEAATSIATSPSQRSCRPLAEPESAGPEQPVLARASSVPDSPQDQGPELVGIQLVPLVESASVASRLGCPAARPNTRHSMLDGDGSACSNRANDRGSHDVRRAHATAKAPVVAATDVGPAANTEPAGTCSRAASCPSANRLAGSCGTGLRRASRSRATALASNGSRLLRDGRPAPWSERSNRSPVVRCSSHSTTPTSRSASSSSRDSSSGNPCGSTPDKDRIVAGTADRIPPHGCSVPRSGPGSTTQPNSVP